MHNKEDKNIIPTRGIIFVEINRGKTTPVKIINIMQENTMKNAFFTSISF